MPEYEYKVIAAPTKGVKAKGIKSVEDRFSNALELKMNEMAAEGWEYQRAEALPSIERSGLTSTKTTWHNVLVFRRLKDTAVEASSTSDSETEPKLDAPVPNGNTPDEIVSHTEQKSDAVEESEQEDLNTLPDEEKARRLRAMANTSLKSED